jgi:hypothetical protein
MKNKRKQKPRRKSTKTPKKTTKEKNRTKKEKTINRRVNGLAQHRAHAGGVGIGPANGWRIGIAAITPLLAGASSAPSMKRPDWPD